MAEFICSIVFSVAVVFILYFIGNLIIGDFKKFSSDIMNFGSSLDISELDDIDNEKKENDNECVSNV